MSISTRGYSRDSSHSQQPQEPRTDLSPQQRNQMGFKVSPQVTPAQSRVGWALEQSTALPGQTPSQGPLGQATLPTSTALLSSPRPVLTTAGRAITSLSFWRSFQGRSTAEYLPITCSSMQYTPKGKAAFTHHTEAQMYPQKGVPNLTPISVISGCHNNTAQTGWLKQYALISHSSGGTSPKLRCW